MKRIFVLLIIMLFGIGLIGCKPEEDEKVTEEELNNYIMQFDESEEKVIWYGDVSDNFALDYILIVLKKADTYPEFKLEYLGVEEAISFKYSVGPRPPDYFFREEYAYLLQGFRQCVVVFLMPQEKARIIEIVREVEKLDFVKHVSPSIYETPFV